MALISYLTTIHFDHGAIAKIPEECAALGMKNPLLVTDRGIVSVGIATKIAALMPMGGQTPIFQDTPTNPTEDATRDALALYKRHACDGVVALGGGSPMDLAKAVALLASHGGELRDYVFITGGGAKITAAMAPLIAIPTTAGTGSEVGRGAVMSFADGRKLSVISPHLIPKRAICDPDLTLGLPASLTAATGMDALTHGIECFISPVENPPAGAIALECVRLAFGNIEAATRDGSNKSARHGMMMASMMGAMAFQKGLGAVHSLSHCLGGLKGKPLHHGTLNAVLLPAVLRYNESVAGELYPRILSAMGLPKTRKLDRVIAELNLRLGMPSSLREMGVDRAVFGEVARFAMDDHCTRTNARPPSPADYAMILDEAW